MPVSVLMSVYQRESPWNLAQSLDSLAAQTLPADEIVIVKDGPLGADLDKTIESYGTVLPIVTLELPVNCGLGPALRAGVEHCRFEWVARMDSDDICLPHRLERQVQYLQGRPEIDVLGASILEFEKDHTSPQSLRSLPEKHSEIRSFAKMRNPLNHMTVIFRKEAVLRAGNYRGLNGFEDYDLWVTMLLRGNHFGNISEPLVLARGGNAMQHRRGSFNYALREIALFWSFRKRGFLTTLEFLGNVAIRFPLRVLPTPVRSWFYRDFLRQAPDAIGTSNFVG